MAAYYHVAGAEWTPGEPLFCWDRLVEMGAAPAWKWEDADEGFDGDVVCLFDSLVAAREFRAEHGGTILAVDCSELTTVRVEEGFPAVPGMIPAHCITLID